MIFETLWESAQRDELLLIDGGFCHWHLRRDGQLTIREIISTRPGAGSEMLAFLQTQPATSIFAKCPIELESNEFYRRKGFILEGPETTKTGRKLNLWRLKLYPTESQTSGQMSPLQLPLLEFAPTAESHSRAVQLA